MDAAMIAFWGGFALLFLTASVLRHLEAGRTGMRYLQRGAAGDEAKAGAHSPESSFATERMRKGRRLWSPARSPLRGWRHPWHFGSGRGIQRQLALAAILALTIGALGLAIETPINTAWAALFSETTAAEPLVTYPERALPKEWRDGYTRPVQYEHMYYQKPPTGQLAWIR